MKAGKKGGRKPVAARKDRGAARTRATGAAAEDVQEEEKIQDGGEAGAEDDGIEYEDDAGSVESDLEGPSKKDQRKAAKGADYGEDPGADFDAEMADLFEKVPPGEGDEFAAVKPWLGAIKEPKDHPKPNKKPPAEKYEMDWVYGYRSEEARMNAQLNKAGQAVYPTAAIGVVFDYEGMKQTYFGGGRTEMGGRKQDDESGDGHSDDVTALCLSFDREMVASGQNGQQPLLMVWSASTGEKLKQKRLPKGCRLVTAVGISASNTWIAASDAAEKITVHIFKVDGGSKPTANTVINAKITHLAWSPTGDDKFGTAGLNHVIVCDWNGKDKCKQLKGKAPKGGKVQSMCSIAWANSPDKKSQFLTGGQDGKVYHWTGDAVTKGYENNKGSVHSIALRTDEAAGGEVALVGGNDKTLTAYKWDGKLTKLWNVTVDAAPRSVDLWQGKILMGLKNGSLVVQPWSADGTAAQ